MLRHKWHINGVAKTCVLKYLIDTEEEPVNYYLKYNAVSPFRPVYNRVCGVGLASVEVCSLTSDLLAVFAVAVVTDNTTVVI